MGIGNLTTELRKEFHKKLDDILIQELRQQDLEDEQKQALVEQLPGLVLPKLTTKEETRAKELIGRMDMQVSQLAELTANIGNVASEYRATLTELTGLLAGKDHNITYRHTPSKIKFMLSAIARVLENDVTNAVWGFRSLPDKGYIEGKLNKYSGI